jgi:peptide/nickel transport system substrate-binding protein
MLKTGAALGGASLLTPSLFQGAFAQAPAKGGHLKMASGDFSTTDSLDPRTYVGTYPMYLGYMWGRPLFRVGAGMKIIPDVAESYDVSADAKTWVITLRKDLTFHNGKTLSSADVIYTINRHRAKEAASGLRPTFDQMETVEATTPTEVTFKLKAPNADWVYSLTDFHLMIQPEGAPADKGIGLGPYMVENYQAGSRTLLKRNPNYWNSDVAHLDSLEFIGINDPNARVSALQTGDVDLAVQIPGKIAQMLAAAGIVVKYTPSTAFPEFTVHSQTSPYNEDLVLALKYALNRQEILDKIFFGNGSLGNDHPIPSFFRFHASDLPQRAYDPDKAKFHLKKSGFSGTLPPLTAAPGLFYGNGLDVAELYQQHAKNAGLDFGIERVPDNGYWANVWNKRPFCIAGTFGRATEDQAFSSFYHSQSVFNGSQTKYPELDQLILAGRAELDEVKRKQIYGDLQELLNNRGGSIIPYFAATIVAMSTKVQGFQFSPLADGSFVDNLSLAA